MPTAVLVVADLACRGADGRRPCLPRRWWSPILPAAALMVVRYAIAPLFRSYAEWIDDTETDVYANWGSNPQDKQSIA